MAAKKTVVYDANVSVRGTLTAESLVGVVGAGVVDHGKLAGLGDDDHPQYVRVDGKRGFSGPVAGAAPVSGNQFVTRDAADARYETSGSTAAHVQAADPHPQYLTQARGDGRYLVSGTPLNADLLDGLHAADPGFNANRISGVPVAPTAPTSGQALLYDGTRWAAGNVSLPGGSTDPNALHLSGGVMSGPVEFLGGTTSCLASYTGGSKSSTIQSGLKIKTPYNNPAANPNISLRIVGRSHSNASGRLLDVSFEGRWWNSSSAFLNTAASNNGGAAPPIQLAWESGCLCAVLGVQGWFFATYNVYSQGSDSPVAPSGAWTIVDEAFGAGASGLTQLNYAPPYAPSGIVVDGAATIAAILPPSSAGSTLTVSGTLAPWTLEWDTARSVFGQSTHRINELSNVFWQADKRFPTTGGSQWIFDGGFDSSYQLPSGVTTIDIPVAGYGGIPADGITYPQGSIYVSFYNTAYAYDSISMQVSGKTAGWVDLGTPTNVSNNANFRVLRFAVPGFNYAKEYKLTVSVPSGALCWITEMAYVLSRWTSAQELPYVDKHQSTNNLFGTLAVNDNYGQKNCALVGTTHSYFNVLSGNCGIGINAPTYKLDVSGNARFTGSVAFGDKSSSLYLDVYRKDDTTQNLLRFWDGGTQCWMIGQPTGGTSGLYVQRLGLGTVASWGYADGLFTAWKNMAVTGTSTFTGAATFNGAATIGGTTTLNGALVTNGATTLNGGTLTVNLPDGTNEGLTINGPYGTSGLGYSRLLISDKRASNEAIVDVQAGNGVYGTRLMTYGANTYLTAYTAAAAAALNFNLGMGNNGCGTNYATLTMAGSTARFTVHGDVLADSGCTAATFNSTAPNGGGNPPMFCQSQQLVTNFNADMVDGQHASSFAAASHNHDSSYLQLGGGTLTGTLNVNAPLNATYSSNWCPTATYAHASTATDSMWSNAAPVAAYQNTNATSGNFTYFAFNDSNGWINAMVACKHVDHSAHTGILQIGNRGTDGACVRTQIELDGSLHQLFDAKVDGSGTIVGDLSLSGNLTMSASKRIKGWTQSKTLNVESPGAAENLTFFYTSKALALSSCEAVLVGGTTPSVTFQIAYGSTRSAAGTNLWSANQVCDSTGAGTGHSNFTGSSAIPAGSWVWFKTLASTGRPTQISVSLEYAES